MLRRLFQCAFFLIFASVGSSVHATVASPLSFDELVKSSDIVAHGFVVDQWLEAPDGLPGVVYTYTRVEVAQVLKGEPTHRITLRQFGGELGGYTVKLSGTPTFELGAEIVVFAGRDSHKSPYVSVGLAQGVFYVTRKDAGVSLSRALSGITFYNPTRRHFSLASMPDRLPALLDEVVLRWADQIAKGGE
jgi:hypothetical protein